MRQRIIHYGATLILMFCIWGHLSELFDHWDSTFQTGSDVEYGTVIVVLVVGAAVAFARIVARALRTLSALSEVLHLFLASTILARKSGAFGNHSPPPPLRI